MAHSWPPREAALPAANHTGAAVKSRTAAPVARLAAATAASAFSITTSSPNALRKCLVRPVMRTRYGASEVKRTVSPTT